MANDFIIIEHKIISGEKYCLVYNKNFCSVSKPNTNSSPWIAAKGISLEYWITGNPEAKDDSLLTAIEFWESQHPATLL